MARFMFKEGEVERMLEVRKLVQFKFGPEGCWIDYEEGASLPWEIEQCLAWRVPAGERIGGLSFTAYLNVIRNQFLPSFGSVHFNTIVYFWNRRFPALEAADLIACGF